MKSQGTLDSIPELIQQCYRRLCTECFATGSSPGLDQRPTRGTLIVRPSTVNISPRDSEKKPPKQHAAQTPARPPTKM
ncbi:hypothetical protein CHS0354_041714 [Potamilus streckersoni]|uniref:Uncharacterized protein n=1 Tax=Potamilus streckersoni TaxID=2493646 RepID=A0AAE0W5G8_9BIVA|nr:hypothetical protein CHS0354_041714 [Potamilus streckersoni]